MSIEKKCSNCCVCDKAGDETHDIYKCLCSDDKPCFSPKEELVREDEKNKFITLLKSDLETLDKDSKHYNNFKLYIESTIELLESEK